MNRFRLTILRRNNRAGSEFDANAALVDAPSQDRIEIDEWSTFRAGVGDLNSLLFLMAALGLSTVVNGCRECFMALALFTSSAS